MAFTVPRVTSRSFPWPLPMTTTPWPRRRPVERPSGRTENPSPFTRTSARSVWASLPAVLPGSLRPSVKVTNIRSAPATTWLLVRTHPEGSMSIPVPFRFRPRISAAGLPSGAWASMLTTAGRDRRATSITGSKGSDSAPLAETARAKTSPRTRPWNPPRRVLTDRTPRGFRRIPGRSCFFHRAGR